MTTKEWKGQRYICLVRASNLGQAESSTEAQLTMLKEYARQREMCFVDEIVLEGVTGSLPGRRADLTDLLERKKKTNDFDVIVLQRIDRLTRFGSGHGFWFEHECRCAGIRVLFVGDDIPEGPYANLIKVAKYEAAQEQAFSISQRSTQGAQLALEQGRNVTSAQTPYACWRVYLNSEGKPNHIIRDLKNGLQQKLHPETHELIDTYGEVGGGSRGHYRKQKSERVMLMPGDPEKTAIVREIFHLCYVQGWGGKRIADLLNRRGIPSPQGKLWSQHQVEVIYEQEVYTGRGVCNRTSSAIYHRRAPHSPDRVDLDPTVQATAIHVPVQHRPREEWFIQEHPLMADFLDAEVRQTAMVAHERIWEKRGDPNRPKAQRNQHGASDYLLTGLLVAKQDGERMVGVLCGRVGEKVRYYRHRRGRRGYLNGSVYNKMLRAEPLETAVVNLLQEVLTDTPRLEECIRAFAVAHVSAGGDRLQELENLRARREAVRKRTELIVSTLDEATLADARGEFQRLSIARQTLNEQIVTAEAAAKASAHDPNGTVEQVMREVTELSQHLHTMPKAQLREVLTLLVERVEADLETKCVRIDLALPSLAIYKVAEGGTPMRLALTSGPLTDYQTHRGVSVLLDVADCDYLNLPGKTCYRCTRRRRAA